jgi:glycosyltransferase involved in cell wall biosynthesis
VAVPAAPGANGGAPVRVLHVVDYGGPYTGSFVPLLRTAIARARAEGFEAEAIFGEEVRGRAWLSELEADGVAIGFIPRERRAARRRLSELLAGIEGTVILQSHFSRFDVPCVLALSRRDRGFVVWHEHSELSANARILMRNVARFALLGRRVDRILCVAPHIASQIIRRGAPRDRVLFLPNPVDAARFPVITPDERCAARRSLGVDSSTKVVLHFSWDWRRKGGDLLLAAVEKLRFGGRNDLLVVFVGAGPEAARAATNLGIADAVRVVPQRERHTELYAAADAFVSSSRREGMPLAMAEALSRGLGVVATDLPGQRALGDGLASRRIVPLDAARIADEIREIVDRDRDRVLADAARSHEWVRAHLGSAEWSDRLVGVYRDLLAAHPVAVTG